MDDVVYNKKVADETYEILVLIQGFSREFKLAMKDAEADRKRGVDTLAHARNAEENTLKARHSAEAAEASAHRAATASERMEGLVDALRAELRDATGRLSELQIAFDTADKRQQAFERKVLEMLGQCVTGQQNILRDFVGPAITKPQDDAATEVAATGAG